MGKNSKLQVLRANESRDGYVTTGWTDAINNTLTNGSNITNGWNGTIFQDEFKNLWTMGTGTALQVLRVNQNGDGYDEITGWTNASSGILLNSNITDGRWGKIFQDEFKNLWVMGNSKLQVLRANQDGDGYVTTGWINANSELTKNSNIDYASGGTIFQDEFKNLWTMGPLEKLQVLRANESGDGYVNTGWDSNNLPSANGLTKSSNITNGSNGTIFQDEFKNLWAMSFEKLQVLRVNQNGDGYDEKTGWTSANNGLTKGSNIVNGINGTIFQDEFKNLWTMGQKTSLQVLRANESGDGYVTIGWTSATNTSSTNGFNISNGNDGRIFQDEFKNLWVMGENSKLQVLKANIDGDDYVDSW